MKRIAALAACLIALLPSSAQALPVASFTAPATQVVGQFNTYDATNTLCDIPPCLLSYRYYRTTGRFPDRLGTTLLTTYSLVAPARIPETTGTFTVVLKVTNSGSTHGFTTAQQRVTIVPTPVLP